MTDDAILKNIREALKSDSDVCSERIKPSVRGDTVILSGTVLSYSRKLAALEAAGRLENVKRLKDKLKINPNVRVSDKTARSLVRAAIDAHGDVPAETISVEVRRGCCTLSGYTPTLRVWKLAQSIALSCQGILKVKNLMLVDPLEVIEDQVLAKRVLRRLAHHEGLKMQDVRITSTQGKLIFNGSVSDSFTKQQVERLVKGTVGVRFVINQLHVRASKR